MTATRTRSATKAESMDEQKTDGKLGAGEHKPDDKPADEAGRQAERRIDRRAEVDANPAPRAGKSDGKPAPRASTSRTASRRRGRNGGGRQAEHRRRQARVGGAVGRAARRRRAGADPRNQRREPEERRGRREAALRRVPPRDDRRRAARAQPERGARSKDVQHDMTPRRSTHWPAPVLCARHDQLRRRRRRGVAPAARPAVAALDVAWPRAAARAPRRKLPRAEQFAFREERARANTTRGPDHPLPCARLLFELRKTAEIAANAAPPIHARADARGRADAACLARARRKCRRACARASDARGSSRRRSEARADDENGPGAGSGAGAGAGARPHPRPRTRPPPPPADVPKPWLAFPRRPRPGARSAAGSDEARLWAKLCAGGVPRDADGRHSCPLKRTARRQVRQVVPAQAVRVARASSTSTARASQDARHGVVALFLKESGAVCEVAPAAKPAKATPATPATPSKASAKNKRARHLARRRPSAKPADVRGERRPRGGGGGARRGGRKSAAAEGGAHGARVDRGRSCAPATRSAARGTKPRRRLSRAARALAQRRRASMRASEADAAGGVSLPAALQPAWPRSAATSSPTDGGLLKSRSKAAARLCLAVARDPSTWPHEPDALALLQDAGLHRRRARGSGVPLLLAPTVGTPFELRAGCVLRHVRHPFVTTKWHGMSRAHDRKSLSGPA